jgi:glycosyltransferase involved in cell wall biosynthesis
MSFSSQDKPKCEMILQGKQDGVMGRHRGSVIAVNMETLMDINSIEKHEECLNLTVSVVIPTRNRADLLRKALDSALSQTYPLMEIIVIDDASEDSHAYARIEELDLRVRYVRNDRPLGPSGARNAGIYLARGELVAFLDDDDEWLPEKLEKQVREFLLDPEVGAVYCPCKWRDLDTGTIYPHTGTHYAHGWILTEQLIEDHTCGTPTYVVRRNLLLSIGCFDTSLPCREDWDLSIRLAEHCKIAFVDEDLVIAGRHTRPGVSKHYGNLLNAQERILKKYSLLRKRSGIAVDRKAKSRYYASRGMLHCYMGRPVMGAYYHILGIINWPLYPTNYSGLLKSFFSLPIRRALSNMRRKLSVRG